MSRWGLRPPLGFLNFGGKMKNILLVLIALTTAQVFGAAAITSAAGGYSLNRKDALNRKYHVGTALANGPFGVKAKWKYSDQGGAAATDLTLHDSEGLAVTLPDNAIIRDCLIDVVTQPTSSTSSGSLAFSSSATADLKAATVVASLTTTTPIVCLPVGTVGTMIKLSSEATLKVRTGSEALTAGEINVWVEYVLSE